MFTGIVEGVGRVVDRIPSDSGARLVVDLTGIDTEGWGLGQSVALNGVCLTLVDTDPATAAFDLAGETLRVTSLGDLSVGQVVNVERALRVGDRLDGHLVQGHIDGTGRLRAFEERGQDWWLEVEVAPELLEQILPRGSITVDGISLTAAELGDDCFRSTIVPHTRQSTNLGARKPGDRLNLETDVMGKWVRRLWEASGRPAT